MRFKAWKTARRDFPSKFRKAAQSPSVALLLSGWPDYSFASMELDPKVIGFILYCTRQKKEWPDLYDEMCRVAGQGLYQGLHYRDLRKMGLSFSLSGLGTTIQMIESVTESRIENGSFSHQT